MVTLTPVDFDPFANASSATEDGRINTVTVRPAAQGAGLRLVPVDYDPFAEAPTVSAPQYDPMGNPVGTTEQIATEEMPPSPFRSQMDDIVKGVGGGLVRGVAGLVGLPGAASDLIVNGVDRIEQRIRGETAEQRERRVADRKANVMFPGVSEAISPQGIQRGIEQVTGPAYVPDTRAGKFASAAAEFAPGGVIGRTSQIASNTLRYGIAPGLVSEAGGQAFEGSAMEGPARFIGAVGTGLAGAATQRMGSADRLVQNATRDVTPQQLDQMEELFQLAQRQGTPISRAEALQAVTNGATGLGKLQHTAEGMGGMRDFYSQRPAQNQAAAARSFDELSPASAHPSQIGPAIGGASENLVTDVRAAINRATRPMYDAAEQHLVPRQVHTAMMADPLFAQTVNNIRRDPELNAVVRAASDRSVRMYDEVAKQLETRSRNVGQPLNPQHNQTASAVTGNLGGDVKDIAIAADRAAVNGPSAYEAALANQTRLRQQYLEPLLNGPIGKLAGRDTTTRKAIEVLFPSQPLPNSADEISQAMTALVARQPTAARELVRSHVEGVFNEASQRLATSGPSQGGGAKFAAVLMGNLDQAANMQAAVRALPNGDQLWQGFNQFIRVMEAQQFRMPAGSLTAFNQPGVAALKNGGALNNAAQVVGSGGVKLPQKVMDAIQNWNVGRNLDELAGLLTRPDAATTFRQIVETPTRSAKATALMARLTYLATSSTEGRDRLRRPAKPRP